MLKLTKTGIGLLTKQYRSVLRKCWLLNLLCLMNVLILPTASKAGWNSRWEMPATRNVEPAYQSYVYQTITYGASDWDNLVALDKIIGSYPVINVGRMGEASNWGFIDAEGKYKDRPLYTVDHLETITANLIMLDYVLGKLPSGTYVSNMQSMGDNVKALDTAIGAKIASNGHYIKKSDTNSITANLSALDYALYNYYYTFRVDERDEVIDSASFFQKDFSTLQEVDLQSKNPTHLGAFTKCDEVCPRPSERFASSLSREQMFKNNASVDAGTSRYCLRQFGDVVADLLKNTVAKSLRIYEFMNEEVCHA